MKITNLICCLAQSFSKRPSKGNKLILNTCLVLIASIPYAQEIKMYPGINLVLDGNIYFVVNNTAFKNNGSFTAGNSTVKFTGNTDTANAYISGNSYTRFNNLTLDKSANGIILKSAVGVKNVLTVTTGNLYADSNLTLLSDATNTARLAIVPSGANIFGKAMVERYIPAKRAWRLMTAPLTNASSIYNCWQNGGVYSPGKGLFITGPSGANGLDNTNAASLKTWDFARQVFIAVTNTYVSISATNNGSADNTGYFVFIRGDRNPLNIGVTNTNVTTLKSIGRLQVGQQSFTASAIGGGYTLIGNPYASPIDFNLVSRTNLLKRFYVWDATLNSLGGYVTMDDLNNDGIYSKSTPSSQTNEIQSSQAFFVQTSLNGPASLVINETAKSTINNTSVFRPMDPASITGTSGTLNADLYLLNTDNTTSLADGALVEFADGYHDAVTNEDAIKFGNINESVGLIRYGNVLAIERRPVISANDTIFFKLWQTTQRNYQLRLIPVNIYQPGMVAFFEDSYLATSSALNLVDPTNITFTVNGTAASSVTNRFRIIFKPSTVLPISFSSVKAYQVSDKIKVDWQVADEVNVARYEVEKSADGSDFDRVNITAKNATGNYSRIDSTPFTGRNFYRIKSIDRGGAIKYSPIVNVLIETKANHFTISPNPIKGNSINIRFANQSKGIYLFNLFNNTGQLVFSSKVLINPSNTSKILNTNQALPAGIYQLQIAGPANTIEAQNLIIEE